MEVTKTARLFFTALALALGLVACGDDNSPPAVHYYGSVGSGAGCSENLFKAYGAEVFTNAAQSLVDLAAADDTVGAHLASLSADDQKTVSAEVATLLGGSLGGTDEATSAQRAAIEDAFRIAPDDYDHFTDLIGQALSSAGVTPNEINECVVPLFADQTFKASFITP